MGFLELLLLAIGLSMDAFAVSVSDGMCLRNMTAKKAAAVALTFGIFQALMPVIGYLGGSLFYEQIRTLDHWVAFILLGFLGGKMLFEGIKVRQKPKDECCPAQSELTFKLLLVQGIATSIDALAVGISLAAVRADIVTSAAIIGITTTVLCFPAVCIGKKSGTFLNDKAEILGGVILIGIGLKIFISHMTGA